jgi:hypothetical protein
MRGNHHHGEDALFLNPTYRCKAEEAMRPKVPQDWRITWLLVGVALGLLARLLVGLAERYQ